MPALRRYKVFVSHCWEYDWHYHRIARFLSEEPRFRWQNLSVPEDRALPEDKKLEYRLRERVRAADVFLVVVGMEIPQRHWVQWELQWARILSVPVVGVMPNGMQAIPKAIDKVAKCIVGWRGASIVGAIREWALPRES